MAEHLRKALQGGVDAGVWLAKPSQGQSIPASAPGCTVMGFGAALGVRSQTLGPWALPCTCRAGGRTLTACPSRSRRREPHRKLTFCSNTTGTEDAPDRSAPSSFTCALPPRIAFAMATPARMKLTYDDPLGTRLRWLNIWANSTASPFPASLLKYKKSSSRPHSALISENTRCTQPS